MNYANIKAITLDLDDTLWPVWPAIRKAEAALRDWLLAHAPATASAHDTDSMRAIRDEVYAAANAVERTNMSLIRQRSIARAMTLAGDDPALAATAYEVFNSARQEVDFYDDSLAALERLAARYPLAALSNGTADVGRVGIGHHFRFALSAANAGVGKPDARIFRLACERLELAPHEVLHVGDDPRLDVYGANRAGLRSAWINREARDWPHAETDGETAHHEFASVGALADALIGGR